MFFFWGGGGRGSGEGGDPLYRYVLTPTTCVAVPHVRSGIPPPPFPHFCVLEREPSQTSNLCFQMCYPFPNIAYPHGSQGLRLLSLCPCAALAGTHRTLHFESNVPLPPYPMMPPSPCVWWIKCGSRTSKVHPACTPDEDSVCPAPTRIPRSGMSGTRREESGDTRDTPAARSTTFASWVSVSGGGRPPPNAMHGDGQAGPGTRGTHAEHTVLNVGPKRGRRLQILGHAGG